MSRRVASIVVLAATLLALAIADRAPAGGPEPALGVRTDAGQPVADPPGALSSTWYCAAGSATGDGWAELAVVVANRGQDARDGTVTWMGPGTAPVTAAFRVDGLGRVALEAADAVEAEFVSALVEVAGGDVAVEHRVRSGSHRAYAPCAPEASAQWYLANGVTARGSSQRLALFNPFPDDAVVDLVFATEQGRDEPPALQGLVVEARSTHVVEVGDFVRRREVTATTVAARTGRLVVDRLQRFDGEGGRTGYDLALAVPAPAQLWRFPDGLRAEGLTERWHVYNPGESEAVVDVEVVLDDGTPVEPIGVTVPARSQVVVDAADRVPAGVSHWSAVRSRNGVAVVAEREVDGRSPAPRRGWSSLAGSVLAARTWVLAAGGTTSQVDEWVTVVNPGAEALTVSIIGLADGRLLPLSELQDVEVAPAGRLAVQLGNRVQRDPLPVVVEASGPVVVERTLHRSGQAGISASMGIPLP